MDTLTFKISSKYSGYRLDTYLSERFSFRSRSWWQKQISSGAVTIYEHFQSHDLHSRGSDNRLPTDLLSERFKKKQGFIKSSTVIKEGQICEIIEEIFSDFRFTYKAENLEILFADSHIAVVNKPPGLVVHPLNTLMKGSLSCLLESLFSRRILLTHRLDRLTSGIIVAALTQQAASEMSRQFRSNLVKKKYIALVENAPDWQEHTSNRPIGPDTDSPIRLKMRTFEKHPVTNNNTCNNSQIKESVTHFKLVSQFDRHSLIEARPQTGRTHQIRVHLACLGLPVVRDKLYGLKPDLQYFETGIGNLTPYFKDWHGLHAGSIEFIHPVTSKPVSYSCDIPPQMREFIAYLKEQVIP